MNFRMRIAPVRHVSSSTGSVRSAGLSVLLNSLESTACPNSFSNAGASPRHRLRRQLYTSSWWLSLRQ